MNSRKPRQRTICEVLLGMVLGLIGIGAVARGMLATWDSQPVTLWGAKCDGITDDASAINTALSSSSYVTLPSGTCAVGSPIRVGRSGTRIIGSGKSSAIKALKANFNVLEIGGSAVGIELADFAIQGAATSSATNQIGIHTSIQSPPQRLYVHDVYFTGSDRTHGLNGGVVIDGPSNYGQISHCTFDTPIQSPGGIYNAVFLENTSGTLGPEYAVISDNQFNFGTAAMYCGIAFRNQASYNSVINNVLTGGVGPGAHISIANPLPSAPPQVGNVISGNTSRDFGGSDVYLEATAIEIDGIVQDDVISNNLIVRPSWTGIYVSEDANYSGSPLNLRNHVVGNSVYAPKLECIWVRGTQGTLVESNYCSNPAQVQIPAWTAYQAYSVRQFVRPSVPNGHYYVATTAGRSGASEPAWCLTTDCYAATDGCVNWKENTPSGLWVKSDTSVTPTDISFIRNQVGIFPGSSSGYAVSILNNGLAPQSTQLDANTLDSGVFGVIKNEGIGTIIQ